MSQWGAYGYAKHGWTYAQILRHYYTGTAFGDKLANNDIRLLRSGSSRSLALPLSARRRARAHRCRYRRHHGDHNLRERQVPRRRRLPHQRFGAAVTFTPTKGTLRILTATDLKVTGAYRGVIRVCARGALSS